jgi:hypothetical protein
VPRERRPSRTVLASLALLLLFSGVRAAARETVPATRSDPTVCESDLRRRLGRLASDEFQGREAGTEGGRLAGAYLAAEMARVGLEPGGVDGTFFQPFAIPRPVLGEGNRLTVTTPVGEVSYPVEQAWNPFALSPNAEATGPLLFAGYGITAPGRSWDDYAGVDARGKVVLVFRKDPGWNDTRHAAFTAKLENAARHGAVALLLCNDAGSAGEQDPIGHWSAQVGGGPGSGKIPYAFVKRALAARLLAERGPLTGLETGLRSRGPASVDLPATRVSLRTALGRSKGDEARNVIGLVRGRDPALADEVVIVGAHFDHLGLGRFGSLGGGGAGGTVHPGADDNASGTSALVELGEHFAAPGNRPRRSMLFLAFTGEEKGLLGSRHWVEHPTVPLDRVVALINMDMIGRSRDGQLHVGGVGTGAGLAAIVEAAGAAQGLTLGTSAGGSAPSDSLVFFRRQIPVLFLFTGIHGDYHRPTDTADRIHYPGLERVARFARDVAGTLAERPERLTFTQPPAPKRPPVLGIRLDREADGRGVRILAVTPRGPAARAGLAAGDLIVGLAGHMVKTFADLRGTLSRLEVGTRVGVVVLRDGERLEVDVVPEARGRR